MITKEEYLKAMEIVKEYRSQNLIKTIDRKTLLSEVTPSVRLLLIFRENMGRDATAGDLQDIADKKDVRLFLRWRKCGKKSLREIKELIEQIEK